MVRPCRYVMVLQLLIVVRVFCSWSWCHTTQPPTVPTLCHRANPDRSLTIETDPPLSGGDTAARGAIQPKHELRNQFRLTALALEIRERFHRTVGRSGGKPSCYGSKGDDDAPDTSEPCGGPEGDQNQAMQAIHDLN